MFVENLTTDTDNQSIQSRTFKKHLKWNEFIAESNTFKRIAKTYSRKMRKIFTILEKLNM